MNWQPISTAPRHDKHLILYDGERIVIGWKHTNSVGDEQWLVSSENFYPTHWMPLPEPPKETT